MANHLSEQEFADLVQEISRGEKSLSVTRSLSRQFYMNVGTRNVRDLTSHSITGSKLLVLSLLVTSLVLLLACLGLLVNEFRWGALIAVPFAGIFWTVIAGFTTELGSWLSSTVILIVVLAVTYFLPTSYVIPVLLFTTSLYLYRLAHMIAQSFLLKLVTNSYDAYDMLCELVIVSSPDAS